jgi:cytochrome c peroxidase
MTPTQRRRRLSFVGFLALAISSIIASGGVAAQIGQEVAIPRHLQDGEEFLVPIRRLISHGGALFSANWTGQEGGGRPLAKGTGGPLSDPGAPLLFPRNFNRVSAPDANSCAGCHNAPFGIAGGGGDFVTNVFVLGQRFDFATFDAADTTPTRGAVDELGNPVLLQTIANSRATLGMFGSGFIEMLAREITVDLQAIRDETLPGESRALESKAISFGTLVRNADGTWDSSGVEGIPATSLVPPNSPIPPSLIIRPFHQAGRVVSIREFSNNAFNHHHGIQSTERFGLGADPDGDLFVDEMTRADVTAASVFQATLAVPGQVVPSDPEIAAAIRRGQQRFDQVGCTACHRPQLPLRNWIFTEPNPFNPPGNLRPGEAPDLSVDLTSDVLPPPRLKPVDGLVRVPAFTDLKLHDVTCGPGDPNIEPLDMQQPPGSPEFFAGNSRFITRKLWGIANEAPFFHHGQYTTIREAVLAHCGEALESRMAFEALPPGGQDAVIEFLKSLRVLPPGTEALVVDENGRARR